LKIKSKINLYLLEFAINSILRAKGKNIFITTIFTLLIALLASIFFITSSIRYELDQTIESLPEIIIQKVRAGREYDIEVDRVEEIVTIAGVKSVTPRVWGYYYFANGGVNFSIVGINQYDEQYRDSLERLVERVDFDRLESNSSMLVGLGVKRVMSSSYYSDYFNFIKPDGTLKKVMIGGVFRGDTELESSDMIILPQKDAREIFGMGEDLATDIVVKVANPKEIPTIAEKIKLLYPDSRVLTKDDLRVSYQNIFDYKSGLFLALFTLSLFTFFMIIYDKSSGLSSEEKREIGILKAVGWSIDDILKEKFYESSIISITSYSLGILIAFGFVYILQAPLLRYIFEGYSELKTSFSLPFIFDIETLALLFFLSVPIYIGATIIPAWRASTLDVDEVIR
jgi:ABC-type lipoprotein release transport system permease subunit